MFDGLIICAGMRRSASTWQYHVAEHIALQRGGFGWGFVTWQDLSERVCHYSGSTVVLKSHTFYPMHTRCLDMLLRDGRIQALYSYRDLRQVAASLLRTRADMGIDYPNIINELGVIVESGQRWCELPNTLVQSYEQITEQPILSVTQIAQAMQVEILDYQAREIAALFSVEQQLERLPAEYDEQLLMWPNHVSVQPYPALDDKTRQDIESHFGDWLRERGYL